MADATLEAPSEGESNPLRRTRTLVLVGLFVALLAAYFATGRLRQGAWDRIWEDHLAVEHARQRQQDELARRRDRADLRQQLRALVANPDDFDATLRVAALYGQFRRYDQALFMLEEAERLRPGDPQVYRARAEDYLATGRYDRCLEAIDRGLKSNPNNLELALMEADVQVILGWYSEARPLIKKLVQRYGDHEARVHILAALLARQVADSRTGTKELERAAAMEPQNDRVYALLSGLEWDVSHRERAFDLIQKAIRLNPNNADYYLHLGEIQRVSGHGNPRALAEAEQTYRRALELNPASDQGKLGIALCRLDAGDPAGQRMTEELLRTQPNVPAALLALGNLYNRQGRREEGGKLMARYQEQMQRNDEMKGVSLRMVMVNSADTYADMGRLQYRTGAPEKAIVFLRRALRMDPKNTETRELLRRSLQLADRGAEVDEVLAQP